MVEVSASILNMDNENAIKNLYELETALIDYFHIDVMDGKFVEKNTYNKMYEYASYIKRISNLFFLQIIYGKSFFHIPCRLRLSLQQHRQEFP